MILAIDQFPAERFGLVTGSTCTPLFPKRSAEVGLKNLAKKLASERYFRFYDEVSTWQMEHGHMAETFAEEFCQKHHDITVSSGSFIQKGDCGGSLDAESDECVWDWKSPTSLHGWLDYMHDGMSDAQKNQLQMYMYLTGKKKAKIGAFLIETNFMNDNGLVYPVPEDKRMIVVTLDKDPTWEDRLNEGLPRLVQMRDELIAELQAAFGG
jgi:hypothetical protein